MEALASIGDDELGSNAVKSAAVEVIQQGLPGIFGL